MFPQVEPSVIPTGLVQSVGEIHKGNSALFLFSPRNIVDHFKRPLRYNFNNEIINSVTEHMVDHPSPFNNIKKVINVTPAIMQAIVPSPHDGFDMRTSLYSDHWMFVFIADEDTQQTLISSNKITSRSIFIGICSEEPIAQSGMMSMCPEESLNHRCQLIVTKHIKMSKYPTVGHHGYRNDSRTIVNDNIIRYDENVWRPQPKAPTFYQPMIDPYQPIPSEPNRGNYYTLLPGEVKNVAAHDPWNPGTFSAVVRSEDSLNTKGFSKINAVLESPKQHMSQILEAVETGITSFNYQDMIGTFGDSPQHSLQSDDEIFEGYVKSSLEQNRILNEASFLSNDVSTSYLSIGMIVQQYHPKVFPIMTPKNAPAEIIPQSVTCINNAFASLVCAVIPTYLNQVGLSAVGFMYNSLHNAFQVLHIESLLSISQQELQHKWKAFEFIVTNELFPVLKGNGGEFDIQVMSSLNSTTDVILNFMDFQPLPIGTIYQENSVLGGITSPLVGTDEDLRQNSVQLNNFIHSIGSYVGQSK